ncbi:unnamed protein product [Ilex paraguariensis]|uniref:CUE domain-containing protein n=1 Tax=Ilex paraguariensis TaxID=185542 RepID=A0ABC8SZR6_9AQUA
MSLSNKESFTNDKKLTATGKTTSLNPNAAEFIPFALRLPSAGTTDAGSTFPASGTSTLGKLALDRSESSVSNSSDDEAHQYWRRQLPDDITPDFNVMGENDSQETNSIPFSRLSLTDVNETSRYSASTGSSFMLKEQQELSPHQINGNSFSEKMRYSVSSYCEAPSSAGFHHLSTKPWDKQIVNNDQLHMSVREGSPYNGTSRQGFLNDMLNEQAMVESIDMNPLEFLASQFPGFAAESLAEVYFANKGDLNLTIEMLTQLELQVDGGLNQNLNSKALSTPNLSALDFPALPLADGQSSVQKFAMDDLQQNISPFRSSEKDNMLLFKSSSSIPSRSAVDFASAVRKMASHDSDIWKSDTNRSANVSVASSRSSHILASSYNGVQGRGIYGERLQSRSSARAAPVWLETGEAVANIYSEKREEARDHARLRNAYFEQARQAYLIGNKALAKELSVKGQLHNMQMKAAHGKAQESIYRQRFVVPCLLSNHLFLT